MSTVMSLRAIGRQLDDSSDVGRALDGLLASRATLPTVFALGESTHGIRAFPLLRNEVLEQLVARGCRSIVLEIDYFAASIVDEYVCGSEGDLEAVLTDGFSHGFGRIPGNRELVEWLRAHNAGLPPADQVRFYGFDGPVEYSGAPSPRDTLTAALTFLPDPLHPSTSTDLAALLGDESDWANQSAMYDPAASVGNSDRARALRVAADDLVSAVRRAGPGVQPADPSGYANAAAHARTAVGLLRYHAAMATPAADRISNLLSIRAEMMADNLLAIVAAEAGRGSTLVFAHNQHLQRHPSNWAAGEVNASWGSAGSMVSLALGEDYLFLATEASPAVGPAAGPAAKPDTLQGFLAGATDRRAFFPAAALLGALPPGIPTGEPILPGHLPVSRDDLAGSDGIFFITDTDGVRHQYW